MEFPEIYDLCKPYTLTSRERMLCLHRTVNYLNMENILGDYVECGVFKGGSIMNMALTQLNFPSLRRIHLYDTFSGMTKPEKIDRDCMGVAAEDLLRDPHYVCVCSLEEVKSNLRITPYPAELFQCHVGDVAVTLREFIPEQIALLRLDTDWYASTKDELEILYPRLASRGVLIIDDYGHFMGARKASDDFFAMLDIDPKFQHIDYTGVLHIKP